MDIKRSKKSKSKKILKNRKVKAIQNKATDYIKGEDQVKNTTPKRVTNETVAKHREEVLSGARRFKYPLQHSKYRIAIISSAIIIAVVLIFGAFSYSLLYKQQSISDFAYRISQVIPLPVGKVGNAWLRMEEYLFELRQNVHYLVNQENVDFESEDGIQIFEDLKKKALDRVEDNEIVSQLASEAGVTVSDSEVDSQLEIVKNSGGVSESPQTFEDTLRDFYGWEVDDLKRVLRAQLLRQKVVSAKDTASWEKARGVQNELVSSNKDFATVASENSEDELTKNEGGVLGFITRDNIDLPSNIVDAGFSLEDGAVSDVVESPFGLHIVKRLETRNDGEIKIAHILFMWEDIETYIAEYRDSNEIRRFIEIE